MQKAATMQEFTGSAEQELPVTDTRSITAAIPAKSTGSVRSTGRIHAAEATSSLVLDSVPRSSTVTETSLVDPAAASVVPGTARSLERTHDLMSLHALRLRDSSADSLRVVIRPGPGMQLALDLQLRDGGGIDVQASLSRGDYDFLNAHWPELQQQLESRGVRLAPLSGLEHSAASNPDHSDRRTRQEESEPAEILPELPLVTAVAASAQPARLAARGWQTWA